MKHKIRSLKRYAAALLLLAVVFSLSSGSIWAKYTKELTVTSKLSLGVTARYKYHYADISGITAKDAETSITNTTAGKYNLIKFTKNSNATDPNGDLTLASDSETLIADYPYVAITYMTTTTDSLGCFYFKGDGTDETSYFETKSLGRSDQTQSDGLYVTKIVKLSDVLEKSTRVNGIRVDYFENGNKGDVFYLESIVFCNSEEAANAKAAEKKAALNCTINYAVDETADKGKITVKSEEVAINGTPKGSTAEPDAGYALEGWYDGSGNKVSTDTNFIPEKTNGAYPQVSTYTAKFTPIENYTVPLGANLTNYNNTSISSPTTVNEQTITVITVTKANDPGVDLSIDSDKAPELSTHPYVAITYMTDYDGNGLNLYFKGGNTTVYTGGVETGELLKSNGKYVTAIFDMTTKLTNAKKVEGIRIDPFEHGVVDAKFYLDSVVFCPTVAAAEQVATARSNVLNCTINYEVGEGGGGTVDVPSETYGMNSTKFAGSTATPDSDYVFDGWYNGNEKVSETAHFKPTTISGSATYTAKFTPKTTKDVTVDNQVDNVNATTE